MLSTKDTHTIRHRTHRRDVTGGALKELEPNDLIVFPHRYRRDCTYRRDRTGGAKKRAGNFILKCDRARGHPSHDYGITAEGRACSSTTSILLQAFHAVPAIH